MTSETTKYPHSLVRELSLPEIQSRSLTVLYEFDKICTENGFKYWVAAGTLIGAIRHKGFIPWDDDIDVGMPRDDYDKFSNLINSDKYMNNNYSIHSINTIKGYPFYINRFCEKSVNIIFDNYHYKSGCFIDIYPFDGMGTADKYDYWKHLEPKLHRYQKFMTMAAYGSLFYGNGITHKILNIPLLGISKIRGTHYYFEKMEHIRKKWSWDESSHIGVPCWSTGTYIYPKEWFEETIRVPFENISVCIPQRYDDILKEVYGDYMQLPPVEKRVPYHGYHAFEDNHYEKNWNN